MRTAERYNPAMCGRYITRKEAAAEYEMEISRRKPSRWYDVSYNVAPTQQVPVVRVAEGEREGTLMRWGLVPFWAKGAPPKYSTINARIETIETAASYRGSWKHGQRCILPVGGFYEWHVNEDGSKQPFFIHLLDREVFGFAGLWDSSKGADTDAIESCTIITMNANPLMASIHNVKARMPAILRHEDHQAWLAGTPAEAMATLQPYPADLMTAYKVSSKVNSPKNNSPELLEPITRQA